ncbi:Imm30 family immunity protein [Hymenobacter perfusus]|uniref:Immunity protein 30 domain-containing protein n=1 Tax=Hymenobacter perfusus TaxID=1236770 RepID=A0A428K8J4_9BACT|nr:Imm30 family immunity protein [Hymenobacter perfusus]RSK42806.1 hypothetical protein EI293_13485 [Hymenobacter perfusus]
MCETVNINAEVLRLRQSRLMQEDGQYLVFDEAIARILSARNVEHIPLLCQGFDDATEHYEVMFGLIHAVEGYHKIASPEVATGYFIKSISVMVPHASEWAKQMLRRFLNKADDRQILRKSLAAAETNDWTMAVKLLQKIASEDAERFNQAVVEVLD